MSCHPERSEGSAVEERKDHYVYIMASRSLNFYTGMCNNIERRNEEHREGVIEGFSKRYKINRLVYYEAFRYVNNAINREKQVKKWSRAKKIALIRSINPAWQDLSEDWGKKLQIPRFARDDNSNSGLENNHATGVSAVSRATDQRIAFRRAE